MDKTTEILLYLFRKQFEKLREEYKMDTVVFDQRAGREESLERCEQIAEKVLARGEGK